MNNLLKQLILRFSIVLLTISGLLLCFQEKNSDGFGVCIAVVILNAMLCIILIVSIKKNGDDNSHFNGIE